MITQKPAVIYNVNLSVIPISNNLEKYPIRAYYKKTPNAFVVTLDSSKFIHHKKDEAYYTTVSPCPICHNDNLYRKTSLQVIAIAQGYMGYRRERYIHIGILEPVHKYYTQIPLRVLRHNNQQYIVAMHDSCFEKYKLCPLGYDIESNPLK